MMAFFTTTIETAQAIVQAGFTDRHEEAGRRGVWMNDQTPHTGHVLEGEVTLALEVPDDLFKQYEVTNAAQQIARSGATEGWRLALIPAVALNRLDKPRPFVSVIIDAEELARRVAHGKGDHCVDFVTGAIVRAEDCPEAETGEGRPALAQRKRFIRIPTLDDSWRQEKDSLNEADRGAKGLAGTVKERSDYREWCEYLNQEMASENVAMRWLASLRPSRVVGLFEEGLGVTNVYDPLKGAWVEAM
jgi:hypothetical protein